MPKTILESLSNLFGRVRRSELRRYAEEVGLPVFLDNIRNPCLVGVGRFAGEFVERAKDNRAVTIPFQSAPHDALAEESAETGIHESLYPLVVPMEQMTGQKQFRIGRSSTNDIVIPDYSISGEHADIFYERRTFRLEDRLSTNGTVVNGVPVFGKGVVLRDGDKIKLGRFQFLLVWPPSLYRLLIRPLETEPPEEEPMPILLEDLTDALGRFDFVHLKQYCRSHNQEAFKALVRYPVLVGADFFPGAIWQREEGEVLTARPLPSGGQGRKSRPLTGSLFPLAKNPASTEGAEVFVIGRAALSDVRMNDPTISKQHARLEIKEGKMWLSDLGSSNGTSVNALTLRPLVPKEISAGDKIGFGKNHFVFLAPERLYTNMQAVQE